MTQNYNEKIVIPYNDKGEEMLDNDIRKRGGRIYSQLFFYVCKKGRHHKDQQCLCW